MSGIPQGAIRFNTDSQRLEFYAQGEWWVISTDTPNLASAGDPTPGARGFAFGCVAPTYNNYYINIASTGNAIDFGNFASNRYFCSAASDRTRAVVDSGEGGMTTKEFFTMASGGGGTNFGNVSYHSSNGHRSSGAVSNGTRAVFAGGNDFVTYGFNNIEYVTIQSTGDAQDFGDLTQATQLCASGNSPTRGVFASGDGGPALTSVIQFISTSTLGNSQNFGDTSLTRQGISGLSNATRMVMGGGQYPTLTDTIDYIEIAAGGNASDFGDLTVERYISAASSSPTRGVWAGGAPGNFNVIDYVQIPTTGNAVDFGDLLENTYCNGGTSNAHGGL